MEQGTERRPVERAPRIQDLSLHEFLETAKKDLSSTLTDIVHEEFL
jgi:hypothetical protein